MSKFSAAAKNAAGNIQEGVGKMLSNENMVAKGEQKQLEAEQQKIAAGQKNSSNTHSAKGATKQNIGEATHNPHMAAQGGTERYQGNAQHNTGKHNDFNDTRNTSLSGTHHHNETGASSHAVNSGIGGATNPPGTGYTGHNDHSYGNDTYHPANHHHSNPVAAGVPTAGTTSNQDSYRDVNNEKPSTISGKKDQVMGAMKQNVGSTFNNPSLEAKGAGQRTDGHFQAGAAGHKSESITGTANAASDGIQDNSGYTRATHHWV